MARWDAGEQVLEDSMSLCIVYWRLQKICTTTKLRRIKEGRVSTNTSMFERTGSFANLDLVPGNRIAWERIERGPSVSGSFLQRWLGLSALRSRT